MLKLERPIIFFDLETTGTNVTKDRIVEISMLKVRPGENEPKERTLRINPGMPIPVEASNVHHIFDEDVAHCPKFEEVAQKIADSFEGCDIGGFNSTKFDLPLLIEEMSRAKVRFDISEARLVDVQTIFHKKEPRNLVAAYRFYCDKNLEDAHSANADTRATYEVFLAQLERYDDLPQDIQGLAEFSNSSRNVDLMGRFVRDDKGTVLINFGKYKGKDLRKVLKDDPGYYGWIMESDFPTDTKAVLNRVMNTMRKGS
ncbi:MAG: 3'-5' exonuclease [Muribaculaceae bacterium]|nr:3'-5' exonuclease [Muribaculaceae bacterium]